MVCLDWHGGGIWIESMIEQENCQLHDDGVIIRIGDFDYLFETKESELESCPQCSDYMIFNITRQRYECPVCDFHTDVD